MSEFQPKRIYLKAITDLRGDLEYPPEMGWSESKDFWADAPYIRADIADALADAVEAYRATPGTIPAGARLDAALAAYKQAVEGGV